MGNLPFTVQNQDISEFFYECGVTDIYLVKDRETGDLKVNECRLGIGVRLGLRLRVKVGIG